MPLDSRHPIGQNDSYAIAWREAHKWWSTVIWTSICSSNILGNLKPASRCMARAFRVREKSVRRVFWGFRENAGGGGRDMGRVQGGAWGVSWRRWFGSLWWVCDHWQLQWRTWQRHMGQWSSQLASQTRFHQHQDPRHLLWPPGTECCCIFRFNSTLFLFSKVIPFYLSRENLTTLFTAFSGFSVFVQVKSCVCAYIVTLVVLCSTALGKLLALLFAITHFDFKKFFFFTTFTRLSLIGLSLSFFQLADYWRALCVLYKLRLSLLSPFFSVLVCGLREAT